jgi:transposase-like protein
MGRMGYPAEFRRRALDLVAAGKTVAEVARLLEVSDQSIYAWRRQELIDRGELPGLSSEEREELRAGARSRWTSPLVSPSSASSRTPKVTSWPAAAHFPASVRPMLPRPMTAIFILLLRSQS